MLNELSQLLLDNWPYIGLGVFMILTTLMLAQDNDNSKQIVFDNSFTLMLVTFILLGPIGIPVAFRVYKEME